MRLPLWSRPHPLPHPWPHPLQAVQLQGLNQGDANAAGLQAMMQLQGLNQLASMGMMLNMVSVTDSQVCPFAGALCAPPAAWRQPSMRKAV